MAANEDFDMLKALSERLGLEGPDEENFITSSMRRMGYRPRVDWDEPEGEEQESSGPVDFFARSGKRREQRPVRGDRQPPERKAAGGGSGWQYGG